MEIAEKRTYTYEEYAELPEGAPYQLIAGALVMSPAPKPYHRQVSMRLSLIMAVFAEKHDRGIVLAAPLDVFLTDENTFQPDLVFIARDRSDIIGETKLLDGLHVSLGDVF